MRADHPGVLDSNVLAESADAEVFFRLALPHRLISPMWTNDILDEVRRVWLERLRWEQHFVVTRLKRMTEAFPESLIQHHEPFVDQCTNAQEDRHVLAAAIRGNIDTIVTFNIRDFAASALEPWGVSAWHAGQLLCVLYDIDEAVCGQVLKEMAELRNKPVSEVLSRLSASAPTFSNHVARNPTIEFPPYESKSRRG